MLRSRSQVHKYSSRCRHLCHRRKVEQNLPLGVVCRGNKCTNNLIGIHPPAGINNTEVTSDWLILAEAAAGRTLLWLQRSADSQHVSRAPLRGQAGA